MKKRMIAAVMAAMAISGCSSSDDITPVGTGYKTDEFKRSPCACLEQRQPAPTPAYLKRLERRLRVG